MPEFPDHITHPARTDFERWAKANRFSLRVHPGACTSYEDSNTQDAWYAWIAARSLYKSG